MDAMFAVLEAADKKDSPVIIGFGGQFISSPKRSVIDGVYGFGALARESAVRARVPVAVLLNESNREDMVYQGMHAGFNAVMYQNANEDYGRTVEITKNICRTAHMLGIDVESEVGELPNSDIATGRLTGGRNTDAAQAAEFAEITGIDALAVAIGNVHILEGKTAEIDYDLLARLKSEIDLPLVLHGGTGLSSADIRRLAGNGISKINVGTVLKRAYIDAVMDFCKTRDLANIDPHVTIGWGGPEDMISCGRAAIEEKIEGLMEVFGSAGQAGNVMKS